MTVNIAGNNSIEDPFYRYQMESPKFIKQRCMIALENYQKICKDLNVDSEIFVIFIKSNMGCKVVCKKKMLLFASIDNDKFDQCLKNFIDTYVLCRECFLPETHIEVKTNKIYITCDCCGHSSPLLNLPKNIKNYLNKNNNTSC